MNGGNANNIGKGPPYRTPCGGWKKWAPVLSDCNGSFKRKDEAGPSGSGYQVYQNTTLVPCLTCDGWFSPDKLTTPYPVYPCPLDTDPATCRDELDCGENPSSCSCSDPSSSICDNAGGSYRGTYVPCYVSNSYAIQSGSFYNPNTCARKGFRVVYAAKAFHGRLGFTDWENIDPSGSNFQPVVNASHFLTETRTATSYDKLLDDEHVFEDGTVCFLITERNSTATSNASLGRYTGVMTAYCTQSGIQHTYYDCSSEGQFTSSWDYSGMIGIDVIPDAELGFRFVNSGIDDIINGTADLTDWTVTKTLTNSSISVTAAFRHTPVDEYDFPAERTYSVTVTLSDEYSAGDVRDDVKGLLAQWDLTDDVQMGPWRTDQPTAGPLVTYDEYGPRSPNGCSSDVGDCLPTGQILGAPLPTGYAAFWDALRTRNEVRDGSGEGTFCWFTKGYGAWTRFQHATQETEDYMEGNYPFGAWTMFNNSFFLVGNGGPVVGTSCGCDGQYRRGYYCAAKYAEIIQFDVPSHNYARPCGATDRTMIDPETVCNDTASLLFPSASCYCNDPLSWAPPDSCSAENPALVTGSNDTGPKGDYSIKEWRFSDKAPMDYYAANGSERPAGTLIGMTCNAECAVKNLCTPVAVFIQPEPINTGSKYANNGSKFYELPFADVWDGNTGTHCPNSPFKGFFNLVQVHQHQTDPLWRRPKICDERGIAIFDTSEPITIPQEENRECADGLCNNYVDYLMGGGTPRAACLPGAPTPWIPAIIPGDDI